MEKGKSKYIFTVNAPYQVIEDAIQTYLRENKFELQTEDGEHYYLHFDGVWGNRFFEYSIRGYQVTIYAYIGKYKRPKAVEEGLSTSETKQAYRNNLTTLFKTLQVLNATGGQPEKATNYPHGMVEDGFGVRQDGGTGYPSGVTTGGPTVKSKEDEEKANGNKAIIGFILSIVGLLLPCAGIQFGWIVIILEFTFAAAGLKSSKKGLAIATFVLAGIQALFSIFTLVLRLMAIGQ